MRVFALDIWENPTHYEVILQKINKDNYEINCSLSNILHFSQLIRIIWILIQLII